AFEVFVYDLAADPVRCDFQKHQTGLTFEKPIQHTADLMRIGTVDKSLAIEAAGNVLSRLVRLLNFILRCDVINRRHYFARPFTPSASMGSLYTVAAVCCGPSRMAWPFASSAPDPTI